MKATIDIPDELSRRVKAKTALRGRAVRDATIELFQKWVDEPWAEPPKAPKSWLDELLKHALPAVSDLREILVLRLLEIDNAVLHAALERGTRLSLC